METETKKPVFYYVRSKGGKGSIVDTVCVIAFKSTEPTVLYARGVAHRSSEDNVVRKVGRGIAEQRARKVIENLTACNFEFITYQKIYAEHLNEGYGKPPKDISSDKMRLLDANGLTNLELKLFDLYKPKNEGAPAQTPQELLVPAIQVPAAYAPASVLHGEQQKTTAPKKTPDDDLGAVHNNPDEHYGH